MSLPVTSMVTEPHTCNRLQDFRVLCRCAYGCDIVCPPLADIPQPPGAIRLEENVPNTVTVTWEPSASEQWEKNLYYTVLKRESQKGLWHVLGDLIYNNKFTFTRVVPGRDYYFRVVAKNDVGASDPSETVQPWRIGKKKGKTFSSISLCCVLFLSLLLTHTLKWISPPGNIQWPRTGMHRDALRNSSWAGKVCPFCRGIMQTDPSFPAIMTCNLPQNEFPAKSKTLVL